jgi:hypothetical protein
VKALTAIALLAFLAAGGAAVTVATLRRYLRRRELRRTPWELEERSDGELLHVFATRPGEEDLLIGAVPFASNDFDYRIETVRSDGERKVTALNNRPRYRLGRGH